MALAQMNTRLDAKLKERGDRVFARRGYTPSQVVRAVWEYADVYGDVPPFMREKASGDQDNERTRRLRRVQEGFGLATRAAQELAVYPASLENPLGGKTWSELRDEFYDRRFDDLLERMGQSC